MRGKLGRWWPVLKALLGLVILLWIGRQFVLDLRRPELWQRSIQPGWLALSALLYLLGMGVWALYWGRLLAHLGQPAPPYTVARAYFISQLGKYIPGKAWAVLLRIVFVRGRRADGADQNGAAGGGGEGVKASLAGMTTFYEVLTTMASGALLATLLFTVLGTEVNTLPTWGDLTRLVQLKVPEGGVVGHWTAVALAGGLTLVTGLPLVPVVFNRLAKRMAFARDNPQDVPRLHLRHLVEGLGLTAVGWLFLGASLAAALQGVLGADLTWTAAGLARVLASLGLAYVAGFVILITPGGLGVREFFLSVLLAPELVVLARLEPGYAEGLVLLTVLVMRLVWTLAEVLLAVGLYLVPGRSALVFPGRVS